MSKPKEMTDEEKELFNSLVEGQRKKPLEYIKHDIDAHRDPALIDLCEEQGYRTYGMYWTLAELLAENETHYFDSANQKDLRRLTYALGSIEPVTQDDVRKFFDALAAAKLIDAEIYEESGRVIINRILRNVEEAANCKAWRQYGAIKKSYGSY